MSAAPPGAAPVEPAPLAVLGPTATGKTALAVALAERLGGEVVTCDSVQVYRGLDIGSAKPTPQERRGVVHHLIDVAAPGAEYNAARYAADAAAAIAQVRARGRVPIICGGTGLYFRALQYGLVDAPPANPALRARLLAAEAADPGHLRRRLTALDPAAAAGIPGNNLPRLVRSLELCLLTGEPASQLRARHGFRQARYPGARVLVLDAPIAWLRRRLERREQEMLDAGLLAEIEGLWATGVPRAWRVWRAVTYRQACDYLEGRLERARLVPAMVQANVAYARRQRTWFGKEPGARWIAADAPDPLALVEAALLDAACGRNQRFTAHGGGGISSNEAQ